MDLKRLLRNQWDRTLAIGLALLGLLAIYLGYRGVADAVVPAQQIPYLASGAVLGLFLLGAGATIWLSSDLRDEWRRIDELLEAVEAQLTVDLDPTAVTVDPAANGHQDAGAELDRRAASRRRRPLTTTSDVTPD